MKIKKLYLWLFVLAILAPAGILAKGPAWGEFSIQKVKHQVGFTPKGMAALSSIWNGLLDGYNLPGFKGAFLESIGYIFSAIIALVIIFLFFRLLSVFFNDGQKNKGEN